MNSEINLKYLFAARQEHVLKILVWELGGAALSEHKNMWKDCEHQMDEVLLALQKGAILWSIQQDNKEVKSGETKQSNSIGVDAIDIIEKNKSTAKLIGECK